ncbi:TlpA family protein disulfide reductase [Sunxiuqinia indica]|uniref:TlpA family protein disulfide reductase n=1 Tax=Sunxiuqinia indica TaxID=2692584 RepID=UPI00135B83F8|nr:TlpA family protein disulfide reductase [Sunxiuqinia indica]
MKKTIKIHLNIPLVALLFLSATFCGFCAAVPDQVTGQATSTPLKVGDPVPDILLTDIVNYPKGTARFSDFEGKLLILDFWATWCHPCLEAIPRFEKLQREFGNQLQVLMVTSQPKGSIAKFFSNRNISLPSVTGDQTLSKLFPHKYVPHEVWIKDGKVFAITNDAEVTSENIRTLLSANETTLTEKKSNFDYDLTKPLLIDGNGGQSKDLQYHSVITGYLDGIGGGGVYTDSLDRYKIRALNGTILQLYQGAVRYMGNTILAHPNRCISAFDKQEVLPPPNVSAYLPTARDKYYCYELIIPSALKAQAGELMLENLNRFFGGIHHLRGTIEKRKVKCWVLKRHGTLEKLASKSPTSKITTDDSGRLVYQKQPFQNFYKAVASLYKNEPSPVIDRTGITSEIDISFPTNEKDILRFKEYLNQYGLNLEQELCEIDMLVIKQFK